MPGSKQLRVLIVGAGSAAFEALFRLRRVAGDRVATTILAPDDHFFTRSMLTLDPFTAGRMPGASVARLTAAAGGEVLHGRMAAVNLAAHRVSIESGETIEYDALLVATGGVLCAPYEHGVVFSSPEAAERMHGLVQDVEDGYIQRVAFVLPEDVTWPVPLYELALMTAGRAYDQCVECAVTIVTSEEAPLELLGGDVSQRLSVELDRAGVEIRTGANATVPVQQVVKVHPGGDRLKVDRIVTLPIVDGPAVSGLPHDDHGFIPVDTHGRVTGEHDIYVAGDVTDCPIKQAAWPASKPTPPPTQSRPKPA